TATVATASRQRLACLLERRATITAANAAGTVRPTAPAGVPTVAEVSVAWGRVQPENLANGRTRGCHPQPTCVSVRRTAPENTVAKTTAVVNPATQVAPHRGMFAAHLRVLTAVRYTPVARLRVLLPVAPRAARPTAVAVNALARATGPNS